MRLLRRLKPKAIKYLSLAHKEKAHREHSNKRIRFQGSTFKKWSNQVSRVYGREHQYHLLEKRNPKECDCQDAANYKNLGEKKGKMQGTSTCHFNNDGTNWLAGKSFAIFRSQIPDSKRGSLSSFLKLISIPPWFWTFNIFVKICLRTIVLKNKIHLHTDATSSWILSLISLKITTKFSRTLGEWDPAHQGC